MCPASYHFYLYGTAAFNMPCTFLVPCVPHLANHMCPPCFCLSRKVTWTPFGTADVIKRVWLDNFSPDHLQIARSQKQLMISPQVVITHPCVKRFVLASCSEFSWTTQQVLWSSSGLLWWAASSCSVAPSYIARSADHVLGTVVIIQQCILCSHKQFPIEGTPTVWWANIITEYEIT